MAKILITGAAGFIGSNAANLLSKEGYGVIALDNLFLGKKENLEAQATFLKGDVNNPEDLQEAGPVDYIIHLASSSSAPMFTDDLIGSFQNNTMGHLKVLEYARATGVKKVLFASTSSIYGNNPIPLAEDQQVTPPNFYAVAKHCQEEAAHVYSEVYGLEIIGFRFMSVYGLHEEHKGRFANLVSQFIWGIEQERKPVVYGDGTQTRDFTNVKDIVQAFKLAMETPKRFGFTIFNVGTSEAASVNSVIDMINRIMETSVPTTHVENPIKSGYIQFQQADISKISRELGYKPTVTLEEGIREIIEYRKIHPIPPSSMSY